MNRDMALVRRMLFFIEGQPSAIPIELPGAMLDDSADQPVIAEHAVLIEQAGSVEATVVKSGMGEATAYVRRLTWAGHAFLDAIREESVWTRVQKKLAEVGGGASLDLVGQLAPRVLREKLGLPISLEWRVHSSP